MKLHRENKLLQKEAHFAQNQGFQPPSVHYFLIDEFYFFLPNAATRTITFLLLSSPHLGKINKQPLFDRTQWSGLLLIVMRGFPQGRPGLLRELPWLRSAPADALAFGVVNIPKIIQRSGLPNLQQIFTDGKQSDQRCNYILKIHQTPACLRARWPTIPESWVFVLQPWRIQTSCCGHLAAQLSSEYKPNYLIPIKHAFGFKCVIYGVFSSRNIDINSIQLRLQHL